MKNIWAFQKRVFKQVEFIKWFSFNLTFTKRHYDFKICSCPKMWAFLFPTRGYSKNTWHFFLMVNEILNIDLVSYSQRNLIKNAIDDDEVVVCKLNCSLFIPISFSYILLTIFTFPLLPTTFINNLHSKKV